MLRDVFGVCRCLRVRVGDGFAGYRDSSKPLIFLFDPWKLSLLFALKNFYIIRQIHSQFIRDFHSTLMVMQTVFEYLSILEILWRLRVTQESFLTNRSIQLTGWCFQTKFPFLALSPPPLTLPRRSGIILNRWPVSFSQPPAVPCINRTMLDGLAMAL